MDIYGLAEDGFRSFWELSFQKYLHFLIPLEFHWFHTCFLLRSASFHNYMIRYADPAFKPNICRDRILSIGSGHGDLLVKALCKWSFSFPGAFFLNLSFTLGTCRKCFIVARNIAQYVFPQWNLFSICLLTLPSILLTHILSGSCLCSDLKNNLISTIVPGAFQSLTALRKL